MIGYVLREENVILLVFSSGIYQLTAYMDQFQRWFEIRARWPKKLSIADIPGCGRGIVALEQIGHEEELISLPESAMITSQTVLRSPLLPHIQRHPGVLSPSDVVSLFLMIERFKGTESDWWPYLNVLPTDYTTLIASYPMFPAHILPQSSRFLYAAQEKEVEKSYARVKKFCETELPDFSCSLQEFLWAFNTVNSRCVYKENNLSPLLNCSDGDSIAVMPLIDMINHSPTAMVEGRFDRATRTFSLRANHSYLPGQQIFLCYGGHSNARLLIEYGFVLKENPTNSIKLEIDDLTRLCAKIGHQLTPAHTAALRNFKCNCCIYTTDLEASWNLLTTFKLIAMGSKALAEWKNFDCRNLPDFNDPQLYDIAGRCLETLLAELKTASPKDRLIEISQWQWDCVTQLWHDEINLVELGLTQLQLSRLENCGPASFATD